MKRTPFTPVLPAIALLALVSAIGVVPASANVLYDNGPSTYDQNAWAYSAVPLSFLVSDSFTLSQASVLTEADFVSWLYPGDVPLSVFWDIISGPGPFAGTLLASGSGLSANSYWFTILFMGSTFTERPSRSPTCRSPRAPIGSNSTRGRQHSVPIFIGMRMVAPHLHLRVPQGG
jgi:hypothetical protein